MKRSIHRSAALLFLACLLPAVNGLAETDAPGRLAPPAIFAKFHHITTQNGLSNDRVWGLAQDRDGFIWIGTSGGLNRYGANTLKVFRHEPDDPHSLSGNGVRDLYVDRGGTLWVGTWFDGLNRFDASTERFVRYRHDPEDPDSLGGDQIRAIHEDRRGHLWIGVQGGGLNRLDRRTGEVVRYRHDASDPRSLIHDSVFAIHEDRSNTLWVGTLGGLERFDRETETFVHFRHDPADSRGISENGVRTIYEDTHGELWIGVGDGLNRFDPRAGRFTHYRHDPADPGGIGPGVVYAIVEDNAGFLWAAIEGNGLNRMDRRTGTFVRYRHNPADPHSLINNNIWSMIRDRTGVLWIAADRGVSVLDPGEKRFHHYRAIPGEPNSLIRNPVHDIYQDRVGMIWIGTVGALSGWDRSTGRFVHFQHDPDDPGSLPNFPVEAVHEDRDGTLWTGASGGGLSRLNRETGAFAHFVQDDADPASLSHNVVDAIHEDRGGVLWVGTWGGGLNRFDRAAGRFFHYRHDSAEPGSLIDDQVNAIYEDRTGTLWVGTMSGLDRFDRETGTFIHYYNGPENDKRMGRGIAAPVFSMVEDRLGRFWIGTGKGLGKFDPEKGRYAHYTVEDGLPNDVVFSILEADPPANGREGDLWLGTSNGLSRFNPVTETFRDYDAGDGLQSDSFFWGACKTRDGALLFGGAGGLTAFYPERIQDNRQIPPVFITHFQLAGKPVPIGGDSVLRRSILETRRLTLSHLDRVFSFEFTALNYQAPEKNRYRYRLEGFEDQWTEVGAARNVATYTNLNPGSYTFRVKGANNDGFWNETGASIAIDILPPWWETAPFRIVALLLAVGLLMAGYRRRVGVMERQKRRLAEQVRERTAALERRTEELRENEEKYRGLVEGVDEVIFRMSIPDGTYQYISPAVETVFGYPAAACYENPLFIRDVIHPDFIAYFQDKWADLIAGQAPPTYEYKVIGPDGDERWILQSNKGIFDGGGAIVAIEGICRNITEIKQHQERLRKAMEKAEAANRAKNIFLANMSHDLRTPLNAILGYSRILGTREHIDEDTKQGLDMIHESGQFLLALVDDLLDISTIAAGKTDLRPRTVRLKPFLAGIVDMVRFRADEKNIELCYSPEPGMPEFVEADDKRLGQVLLNLLGNAVKFTDAGRATFRVMSAQGPRPQTATLMFEVEDTGPGIPPDQLETIFAPFEQGGPPNRRAEGAGLGLAISRRLVQLMGGDLEVQSEPGKGSRFRFGAVFPIPDHATEPAPRGTIAGYLGVKRRILVIDDKTSNRMVLRDMLVPLGFDVVLAGDGAEGLRISLAAPPHLIFTDLVMPDMDGFETARRFRETPGLAEIPVVAVSAGYADVSPEWAERNGFDGFLRKPVDVDRLYGLIKDLLGLEWTYRENDAESPFDWDDLLAQVGGDQSLMREFIAACLEDIAEEVQKLGSALEAGNWSPAVMAAHTIKGLAGNMRSASMEKTALEMERAAKGKDLERASQLMERLYAQFKQLESARGRKDGKP